MAKKRSRKNKAVTIGIVLALCIAILVAVVFWDKAQREQYMEDNTHQQASVAAFGTKEVEYVKYVSEERTVTLVKENDVWYMEEDPDFPVDQSSIRTLLNSLCIITGTNEITGVTDLAQYGLAEPFAEVFLREADGTEGHLAIGDKSDFLDNYYVYRPDLSKEVVYTVNNNVASVVKHDMLYWIEQESMPVYQQVTGLTVTNPNGETKSLICEPSDNVEIAPEWFDGVTPVAREDIGTLEQNLMLLGWDNTVAYEPTEEQWAEFGLSEGCYAVTVSYLDILQDGAENSFEIMVSRDGEYGSFPGHDRIYTLTTDIIGPWVDLME